MSVFPSEFFVWIFYKIRASYMCLWASNLRYHFRKGFWNANFYRTMATNTVFCFTCCVRFTLSNAMSQIFGKISANQRPQSVWYNDKNQQYVCTQHYSIITHEFARWFRSLGSAFLVTLNSLISDLFWRLYNFFCQWWLQYLEWTSRIEL